MFSMEKSFSMIVCKKISWLRTQKNYFSILKIVAPKLRKKLNMVVYAVQKTFSDKDWWDSLFKIG